MAQAEQEKEDLFVDEDRPGEGSSLHAAPRLPRRELLRTRVAARGGQHIARTMKSTTGSVIKV